MRGEENPAAMKPRPPMELPPHARRREDTIRYQPGNIGITSACAEKSTSYRVVYIRFRNYLRMRGEERFPTATSDPTMELPPHARRRGCAYVETWRALGITSACAEKRWRRRDCWSVKWNYLRMRGEERTRLKVPNPSGELPPHARRRDIALDLRCMLRGITSACAEKSPP